MLRCMHCMKEFDEAYTSCPHCGAEYTVKPSSGRHLRPSSVLNERYIVGYSLDINSIFVTYIAFDKLKERRVLINEYLPNNFAVRHDSEAEVSTKSGDAQQKYYAGREAFADECRDLISIQDTDVIDGFEENNTFYAVRRIVSGTSLSEIIDDDYEITNEYARHVIVTLLRALEPVHELGIVHGNLTPDTIIIDKNGSLVITDFGFVGYMARIMPIYTNEGYSPIEQYKTGAHLTAAADVYSVAAIYYELITGEIPVSASQRAVQDTLVPISEAEGVTLRHSACNAIMNALNIKAENRTQTLREFYSELKSKDTSRKWERHYIPEKSKPDFYRHGKFWMKALIWTIVAVTAVCAILLAYELSSIRKELEDKKLKESEVSTEAPPEAGKSILDIFRSDEESEPVSEAEKDDGEDKKSILDIFHSDKEDDEAENDSPDDKVVSGSAVQ